ncbi:condensation domain-containing protein [Acaryochloris marina]|uniref:Nonribosomal protein synthetase condensation domain n=1 Tax=Acaryochloris marina (strain MBIC 11017) TaxID=329726 RepID=A8ZKN5_ACAM1|nr:condensation domain-containing protein [Acaryochloris marina]ABW31353.1 nonribosomal protein synthetase condensation domain [Acaryochloris marina MBIC11017]
MNTAVHNTIQDIYELTPIQKGILFHSLYAPEVGLYLMQTGYTVRGHLNRLAFERALQHLAQRHTILRTSFHWEEADKPLQVVHRQATIPLEYQDWRDLSETEQAARLQMVLKCDRERGFDFSQPPLLRMTIIRLADQDYEIIQTEHHLILDGWSGALVMGEVIQLYQAFCQGQDSPLLPSIPFKTYLSWLRKQDLSKAERYWRQALQPIKASTPIVALESGSIPNPTERYDEQQIKLSATLTADLQALARQHQLTLNTLFQGTWALLLSRYSGQDSVIFGCCVSGRPVDLPGVESMVGVFINTLPVYVDVRSDQPLLPWLKRLQAQQVEMRQYEYSPLVDVQGWSPVSHGNSLFESIVVFENYPILQMSKQGKDGLELQKSTVFYKTNYPLTLVGYPGSELVLGISYDCRRFDAATIGEILNHFERVFQLMIANPDMQLQDISLFTPVEQNLAHWLYQNAAFDDCWLQEDTLHAGGYAHEHF